METNKKYNYEKLMSHEPTEYTQIVNAAGQTITMYEHPLQSDIAPVILVIHSEQFAQDSDFFETDDMTAGGDYEPVYIPELRAFKLKFEL